MSDHDSALRRTPLRTRNRAAIGVRPDFRGRPNESRDSRQASVSAPAVRQNCRLSPWSPAINLRARSRQFRTSRNFRRAPCGLPSTYRGRPTDGLARLYRLKVRMAFSDSKTAGDSFWLAPYNPHRHALPRSRAALSESGPGLRRGHLGTAFGRAEDRSGNCCGNYRHGTSF